jgi:hypothetical protein
MDNDLRLAATFLRLKNPQPLPAAARMASFAGSHTMALAFALLG